MESLVVQRLDDNVDRVFRWDDVSAFFLYLLFALLPLQLSLIFYQLYVQVDVQNVFLEV